MERFLTKCAEYIYQNHTTEMHDICVVFPNRRSGVFFNSYLQKQISNPVIGPETTTINELFNSFTDDLPGEKLFLISILFDVFKKHTNTTETFDEFYFWGEILLADFNDIDRYLVNAKDLFRNISDIKEIDTMFEYLTDEQKQALEYFWGSVAVTDKKEFQKKYIQVWDKLYPVYFEFKTILKEKKLAFGGMNARNVIEKIQEDKIQFEFKKYYFVGLNALNNCEKALFQHLQKLQKVSFLWDYDLSYLNDSKNEAGWFMRENIKQFPSPNDFLFHSNLFQQKKEIKFVAVSSIYGQSQEIPNFIRETKNDFQAKFDNTAIVLADETLLFSALSAIPESTQTVNVTMGYPVKNSVVYGFLMLLINVLKNRKTDKSGNSVLYHRFVTDVLNHQLLGSVVPDKSNAFVHELKKKNKIVVSLKEIDFSETHKIIFTIPESVEKYSDYFLLVLKELYRLLGLQNTENKMLLELVYSVYQTIEKLKMVVNSVLKEQKQTLSNAIYFKLFNQYLGQVSVAFEGEPLSGMQVMGILETRCLDFKNLIILGLNENKWPRTFTAPSFIPFNIRKGFGLPGIDEQDAMYAYYFYRLIQRAKNVTAVYSVVKEGISTGELSRFAYQLIYDSEIKPKLTNLNFAFANDPVKAIKTESNKKSRAEYLSRINREHPLSPSAINVYLQCKLRFYFRYFLQLPEPDEVKDEIDSPVFGNIFHETIEALYKPFIGKVINESDIVSLQNNKVLIENELRKAISKHYFKEDATSKKPIKLEGKTRLIFENSKIFINQLLQIDKENTPFTIVSLENKYKTEIEVNVDGKQIQLLIGGKIDRVDKVNGNYRILDYKTGNVESFSFSSVEEVFEQNLEKPKKEILQALIYTLVFTADLKETANIQPAIYSLRKLFDDSFSPYIKYNKQAFSFAEIKNDFKVEMRNLIEEIFSADNIFTQTPHEKNCQYCAFNKICQRF